MLIEKARSTVRDTIDADHRLHTLYDMQQLHDDPESNVIQVDGVTCVGVPIGSPDFITAFVKQKRQRLEAVSGIFSLRQIRVLKLATKV